MELFYQQIKLPFQRSFATAHGVKTEQPAILISLKQGIARGWGEATAIAYYGWAIEGMVALLEQYAAPLARYALIDPRRYWHYLHHLLPEGNNPLMAALDTAAWDLVARQRRQPLKMALGFGGKSFLPTDYTIGHGTAAEMLHNVAQRPWPCYKVKITGPDDLDVLIRIRNQTKATLRVDANESLGYDDARKLMPELHALGVEVLEQPLARGEWEAMEALKAESPVELFADEACHTPEDLSRCAGAYHGIVIKLSKCGGISPALVMLEEARKRQLKAMIGSMNESSVGTAALVHLACGADLADTDGPLLLSGDTASGLSFDDQGMPVFSSGIAGSGVEVVAI